MSKEDLTNISAPNKPSDVSKIFDALFVSVFFLAIAWSVFLMDEYLGYNVTRFGIYPREWSGLVGIFTMHFVHGDLSHIWHNTLAFLVLNSFLFYFYRSISIKTFFFIFFTSGITLWLIGRPTYHIGASMLLYGQFSFLFFSGLIRKNQQMLRVALVVALYYGSLVWYLFPVDPKISWEGHLAGFLAGVAAAFLFRKQGPQRKIYQFEVDEELEVTEENDDTAPPEDPKSKENEYWNEYLKKIKSEQH